MTPKCCGLDSVWVENVPGKGYHYCRECKLEVSDKKDVPRLDDGSDANIPLTWAGTPFYPHIAGRTISPNGSSNTGWAHLWHQYTNTCKDCGFQLPPGGDIYAMTCPVAPNGIFRSSAIKLQTVDAAAGCSSLNIVWKALYTDEVLAKLWDVIVTDDKL